MLFLALSVFGHTVDLAPDESEPSDISLFLWEGDYSKKSSLCTSPGSGEPCPEGFSDLLKIESVQGLYLVTLLSIQADQHVCSFSFHMGAIDGGLVYKSNVGNVLLRKTGESLKIFSSGIDPTALGLGVCGAHADIDGLEFPLASNKIGVNRTRQLLNISKF
jgi:hypothetical protein